MLQKGAFIFLFALFSILLTACAHQNEKIPPESSASAAAAVDSVPDAAPSLVSEPESSSADKVVYDKKLAAYITVEENCSIVDYADLNGETYRGGVFQLRSPEHEYTDNGVTAVGFERIYWEIAVLRNDASVDVLRVEDEEAGSPVPACADLVTEIDVDFDGSNDLVFRRGRFGAQAAFLYKCWLTRNDALVECPSFDEIMNPAVDLERKELLSTWRNMAVSHGYGIYRFQDEAFVMTERLTEQPEKMYYAEGESDEEGIVWSWTDEILVDGEWQVRDYFTEKDYDRETLCSEKVYGSTAYWDIGTDRWYKPI